MAETEEALRRDLADYFQSIHYSPKSARSMADALLAGPMAKHTAALEAERDSERKKAIGHADHVVVLEAEIAELEAENAALRSEARAKLCDAVCDSYARENQQFYDRFEAAEARVAELEAENTRLLKEIGGFYSGRL